MKVFVAIAALLHLATCSHVSVRMPYQNPAGVTYVNGFQGQEYQTTAYGAAATYAQSHPLQYQAPSGFQYQYPGIQYQSPLQYQAGLRYATPAAAVYQPAKVEAHHVGYAAAQVPAVAAVPFVKHVPTVSNIPVTRYEAHHGVIEKQVDVAKPAVSTRKFEVRRPAIQKQFYDIEERVIIRPAGSALVELDEPTSKLQRGAAVLSESSPLAANPSPFSHHLVAHSAAFAQSPSAPTSIPIVAHAPVHVTVAPVFSHSPVSHVHNPAPSSSSSASESERTDDESVIVENADFRNSQFRSSQSSSSGNQNNAAFGATLFRSSAQLNENQVASRGQEGQYQEYLNNQQEQSQFGQRQQYQQEQSQFGQRQQYQQEQSQFGQRQQYQQEQSQFGQRQNQNSARFHSSPNVLTRSNGEPLETIARFASQDSSPSVVPSTRSSPEEGRSNQQKLIDLLTARGGVAEVGFGRDGSSSAIGDAGNVRARVLSATPAPEYSEPAGERVSTRRVVVSKPVETLQEIDVLEPATKFERVSVQHPTLFKTAHLDHVQVHSSVPVIGKALTPAVAHAAVPVFQKTITPAAYHQYY